MLPTPRLSRPTEIAACTAPLPAIPRGSAVLIADVENLTLSAKDLGYALLYDRLARVVSHSFATLDLHAFFSREKGDETWVDALNSYGWQTHPRDIERATTFRGKECFSNSDHIIAFGTGMLAANTKFDTILLGTGDGALGCDLANAIRKLRGSSVSVRTLSIAGSTSRRLNAASNSDIDSNIEIGLDCFLALPPPTTFAPAPESLRSTVTRPSQAPPGVAL